jgi:type II secretory ATPase GspE/PulE/Tfp pilus assembly ATPase PilB-like protein
MVGEIRDHETADIAIKASQTGHLVLSTLHTQDAPSALVRLRNMGMASYNLASSISLISAQRLVRRLCVHCRKPMVVSTHLLKELGLQSISHQATAQHHFHSAEGCSQCYKGYWGRIGLFQMMPITAALQHQCSVVLPITTAELYPLSLNKQKLEENGLHIAISDYQSLNIANNKARFYSYLTAENLPCVRFRSIKNKIDLVAALSDLGFPTNPLIMKPAEGNGSRGFKIIQTLDVVKKEFFSSVNIT